MRHLIHISLLIFIAAGIIGCSNGDPSIPLVEGKYEGRQGLNHQLWGLWQFAIDPVREEIGIAQVRSGELHLNALSLLEPPPNVNITIEGTPIFNPPIVTIDIGIHHPAPNVKFTGFDVKGILIGYADQDIEDIPALEFALESGVRLENADGYTRWWNPTEFPPNEAVPHQGYIDGLLGGPDDTYDFNSTLNPYKYYCDALDADSPIEDIPLDSRGYFSAGEKNVRTYVINFATGLIFNYAVDANWAPPTVPPPDTKVPDDFPPGANQPEPYRVVIHEITNTLVYNTTSGEASGALSLAVDIYDWVNADQDIVCGYPTNGELIGGCNFFPSGGGEGYSTYTIDTGPSNMTSADDILLWVAAECMYPSGYNGLLPFETQGTYFPYIVTVKEES